jgi:hypothetical protein
MTEHDNLVVDEQSERYFEKDGLRISKERAIIQRLQVLAGGKSAGEVILEAAILPEPIFTSVRTYV